jgi:hypothetical protein
MLGSKFDQGPRKARCKKSSRSRGRVKCGVQGFQLVTPPSKLTKQFNCMMSPNDSRPTTKGCRA